MFTRTFSAFVMLCALGACDRKDQSAAAAAPGLECRTDGGSALRAVCTIEKVGTVLTVRHPGGAFRRFHILPGGKGLESADGAEQAQLTVASGNAVDVTVGDDLYRMPATIVAR
jgi:hypothetical protein